jgi:hypothetical protein
MVRLTEVKSSGGEKLNTENELIHHRLSWLLASQSLLFMAHASLLKEVHGEEQLNRLRIGAMKSISLLGCVSSVSVLMGVVGAIVAFVIICREENRPYGVHVVATALGFFPALAIPLVSAYVWLQFYRQWSLG